jgi:hypothetical protein
MSVQKPILGLATWVVALDLLGRRFVEGALELHAWLEQSRVQGGEKYERAGNSMPINS